MVALQFQAGFCAQEGRIEYCCFCSSSSSSSEKNEWVSAVENNDDNNCVVEWEDTHELQTVPLRQDIPSSSCTSLRFILEECTDFYGRVILYQVQVWGKEGGTTATPSLSRDE